MNTIEFPRPMLTCKTFLHAALAERDKDMFVGRQNPDESVLPDRWIRIRSNGGTRSSLATWDAQLLLDYYDRDEDLGEVNSLLIHSLMLDAPGVGITLPGGPAEFPWVIRTRHISGPSLLGDEDLPKLERYLSVVTWTLHYLTEGV